MGLGGIGRRCAAIGKAFGMRVIGIRRRGKTGPVVEEADEILGLEDRCEVSSWVGEAAPRLLPRLQRRCSMRPEPLMRWEIRGWPV